MTNFTGTERFRVVRELGSGGMGVVYEVFDNDRGEPVALKTLHEMEPDALLRFKREFRALHGMEHPNLVRLGELFESGGLWFFTMELVAGVDLLGHVWTRDWRERQRQKNAAATIVDPIAAADLPSTDALDLPDEIAAFDEARLRDALAQLARGIAAVHAAEKVHRDVKPSNVVVTREGRVVLLDFGLITGMTSSDRSTVAGLRGTPAYMAPEQISTEHVGPAADWYAFGVILFQALTGRLPLDGTPMRILMDKPRFVARPPSAFASAVPEDLDRLCAELLRLDPSARPSGAEILARLGADALPLPTARASSTAAASLTTCVGRDQELEALAAAWRDRGAHRATMVWLDGASGLGKSALIRAFVKRVEEGSPEALVLEGRAFEHESIPFNLFDRVVDSLSRALRALPLDRAAELVPLNAFLLPRVFPVLGRVEAIARLSRSMRLELDAQELRTRVFGALREMLARLAARRPVLIVLDDAQWAGRDSLLLLGELVRTPDPPPLMLLVASRDARLPDPGARASHRDRDWWALPDDLRRVSLGPLATEDSVRLAQAMLDQARSEGVEAPHTRQALDRVDPRAIAEEAGGHPMFVQELVRHAASAHDPASGRPRLDDVILARVRALEPATRGLLELAALSAGPTPLDVIARAAEAEVVSIARRVTALEREHLLRTELVDAREVIEPYHDRVREAVVASLDEARRTSLHRSLATAHERGAAPDPVKLTRHLAGAGEVERAAASAVAAADDAARGLAFDRAAELYQLALELRPATHASNAESRAEIRDALAQALANAGRCLEASAVYLAAAQGRTADEAIDLRGRAAQQCVRGGHYEKGIVLGREVLASMGVHPPARPVAVIVGMLWLRLRLALRGLALRKASAEAASKAALRRVDFLQDLGLVTLGADGILGQWLSLRTTMFALDSGDPARAARALATDAFSLALVSGGWSPAVRRRVTMVRELDLARGAPSPWTVAMTSMVEFTAGHYRACLELADAAIAQFAEEPGTRFEALAVEQFALGALFHLGRLRELRARQAALLAEATAAGDAYYCAVLRLGVTNMTLWLSTDQAARSAAEVSDGEAIWARDQHDFIASQAAQARIEHAIYVGDGALAYRLCNATWRRAQQVRLLDIAYVRELSLDGRGRAAITAIAGSLDASDRAKKMASARRDARALERMKSATAAPRAAVLRAGIAGAGGEVAEARRRLMEAAIGFDAVEMGLHAASVRRQLGAIDGGEEGRALVEAADAALHAQGVTRPDRWAQLIAPMASNAQRRG